MKVLKICLLFLISCAQSGLMAQTVKIFTERDSLGISYFAQNPYHCPVQCRLVFNDSVKILENTLIYDSIGIIPPQTPKQFMLRVAPDKSKKSFRYESTFLIGNPTLQPDSTVYMLPYQVGKSFKVIQKYFGRFSHIGQHAIDFKMPVGTPICASRSGIVVKLKQDSNIGGKKPEFSNDANYIIIYHQDGTMAYYYHLKQNGVSVKIGEEVKAGQIIGYSGNTGWSTTPHLHFVVKSSKAWKHITIPTLFWANNRKKIKIDAKKEYRSYPQQEND
jgi:murein DD-endopeptidase MepM/ murein hydrolase activator NlpD